MNCWATSDTGIFDVDAKIYQSTFRQLIMHLSILTKLIPTIRSAKLSLLSLISYYSNLIHVHVHT